MREVEAAMNVSTYRGECANPFGLSDVLTAWWQQQRLRHEFESLDDTILRDMGVMRGNERFKASFSMN